MGFEIVRKAVYQCVKCEAENASKSTCKNTEIQQTLSVVSKPGETYDQANQRLRGIASKLTPTFSGCRSAFFIGILGVDIAEKKPEPVKVEPASAEAPKLDKCAGEWKNKAACKK